MYFRFHLHALGKMVMKTRCVLMFMVFTGFLCGSSQELKYISTVFTPDSILQNKQNYKPLCVVNRWRYGTCSGACWFHDSYLATVNIYGEKIITYRFDEQAKQFSIVQQIQNQSIKYPEQLNISPDGTLLAICNTRGKPIIYIFMIDLQTHLINPVPVVTLPVRGFIHNLRFSPNGHYFAYASFEDKESLCIYKVIRHSNGIKMEHLNTYASNVPVLKAKAVNFTKDNNYIIRGYALSVNSTQARSVESLIVVHKFNVDGSVGGFVSEVRGDASLEDLALVCNDTAIILTDQNRDVLCKYPFDSTTGRIGTEYTIERGEGELSFPHGIGASPNGKYVVVTNYGNDSFSLYEVN